MSRLSRGCPAVLARPDLDPKLARLADEHGVDTWYVAASRQPALVSADGIAAVLDALGAHRPTRERLLPPIVVVRSGASAFVDVRAERGTPVRAQVITADGERRPLASPGSRGDHTRVLRIGGDLPIGWHHLRVSVGDQQEDIPIAVAPWRLAAPPRSWGWALQLYATRSLDDWGVGDFADLARLADWTARHHRADLLLLNPLHAAAPTIPIEASPYSPASRRFLNPVYLRVTALPEYLAAPAAVRAEVDALRPTHAPDRIDRDATWTAMQRALRLLYRQPLLADLDRFRAEHPGVDEFATWAALAERHGADFRNWPSELRRPDTDAVANFRRHYRTDVDFHVWLQLRAVEQLTTAQARARAAGMRIGLIHDLAVGADGGGADAWAFPDCFASGANLGAPPDLFNPAGQDWGLPPWHPEALREQAYQPFRDIVRAAARAGGGVRVDHILGLFRTWWVPHGSSAAEGAYVRYRDDELLGILALEAHLAGAVVIGEDLGTVDDRVKQVLPRLGVLGSAVLWFQLVPFAAWPPGVAASVTTHDLPTAAGFLHDDRFAEQRTELIALLQRQGLAQGDADDAELVLAMHTGLSRSPARLRIAALADAVGDLRQPNRPGTVDEYPNWRLPLADSAGNEVTIDALERAPGVAALADVMASDTVLP